MQTGRTILYQRRGGNIHERQECLIGARKGEEGTDRLESSENRGNVGQEALNMIITKENIKAW
jgi:hypothetical protein